MKPKILLIGKGGQIGSELARLLPCLGDVTALDRSELDLSRNAEIRLAIRGICPQLIVNTAAYTAVDQAEGDERIARTINSEAPGIMAEEANRIGASLVHFSTDYIFDGVKNSPYEEDDPPNPLNVYGKTKLAGEQAIRDSGVSHLIFRTGWVYATQGRNFLLTILRLATQHDQLRVVHDQLGAPTRNVEIAETITSILSDIADEHGGIFRISKVSGTYHMTAAGVATWYDFAAAILEEAYGASQELPWITKALGHVPLRTTHLVPITTKEYPTTARRPAYSVLSNAKLLKTFGTKLSDWHVQLQRAFESEARAERVVPSCDYLNVRR